MPRAARGHLVARKSDALAKSQIRDNKYQGGDPVYYKVVTDGDELWFTSAGKAIKEWETLSSLGFTDEQLSLWQGEKTGSMRRVR